MQNPLRQIARLVRRPFERSRGLRISNEYIKLNKELHERIETYGTSAVKWVGVVRTLCKLTGSSTILDYGCGKALLAKEIGEEFVVFNYDPAVERYSARPSAADLVVCSDVLEHVEPHLLDAVLQDIQRLCLKASFLVVSTRAAAKKLPDGRNAHLIQQQHPWWRSELQRHFGSVRLVGNSDIRGEAIFVCARKSEQTLGRTEHEDLALLSQQVGEVLADTVPPGEHARLKDLKDT